MNILLDGLSALDRHVWAVFSITAMMVWGHFVMRKTLEKTFALQWTDAESLSLGAAGWILPVALWAGMYTFVVFLFGAAAGKMVTILVIFGSLFVAFKDVKRISALAFVSILLFLVFILLRLAFLQKAVMPSYFDSAEHYRIIEFFSETWLAGIAPSSRAAGTYYHAGYHWIGAALLHFFHIRVSDFMLVFGQVILAVLPLSLFFIIKQESGSNAAGFFSVLLAGIGWHMPSHAVNWGKYPALLSLVCIHFVLLLGYILVRRKAREKHVAMYLLIGVGVLLSTLIHTRSPLVYASVLAAVLITRLWKLSPPTVQRMGFGLVVFAIAIEIGFVRNNPALAPLPNAYLREDVWMLLFAAILLPFAVKYYADLTFLSAASPALFILALFIPIHLPGLGIQTLLDRPFVQTLAYLPLSIIGGLGFAGLLQWMKRLIPRSNLPAHLTVSSLFVLVLINASFNQKFYPSDCCQFVSRDDLAAITWLDTSLPLDTKILIASETLYVTSFEGDTARAGADGGIWIFPLTSRQTVPAWQALDFTQPEIHAEICRRNLEYVYIGGMPQSFDEAQLASRPEWYRPVFSLPAAGIYQVTGCK
jgi:hypothetical protein